MGKVSSKQAAQYTDKQSGGDCCTTRHTAAVEDDVHAPHPAFADDAFVAALGSFPLTPTGAGLGWMAGRWL